jgi:hypothetical protein
MPTSQFPESFSWLKLLLRVFLFISFFGFFLLIGFSLQQYPVALRAILYLYCWLSACGIYWLRINTNTLLSSASLITAAGLILFAELVWIPRFHGIP